MDHSCMLTSKFQTLSAGCVTKANCGWLIVFRCSQLEFLNSSVCVWSSWVPTYQSTKQNLLEIADPIWTCAGLVCAVTVSASSYVYQCCPVQKIRSPWRHTSLLALAIFLPFLPRNFLSVCLPPHRSLVPCPLVRTFHVELSASKSHALCSQSRCVCLC